jgi:osmoprotectant transport system substrate-binding protein
MRTRTIPALLLASGAALALLTACGQAGSSGSSSGSSSGGTASGKACAPVADQNLVVLQDDKHLQNADNVVPAVNAATAQSDPALLPALNAISAKLTTKALISMNASVDVDRKSATDVASGWVEDNNLTQGLQQGSGSIVVGAAPGTERTILATIYADVLQGAGFDAKVQETGGEREIYLPALESGQLQVVPEYLATVTETLNMGINGPNATQVATTDAQTTLAAVKPLADQKGLVFGTPSAAVDQNGFAVTTAFADKLGVKTLSELADKCGDGSLTLGAGNECPQRPFCQPGLEKTYGLKFASFKPYDSGGPLTKAAIMKGDVSIGLVFTSDGALAQG